MNGILYPDLEKLRAGQAIEFDPGEGEPPIFLQAVSAPSEKPSPLVLKSLAALSADVMANITVTLELRPGIYYAFTVRPLDSNQAYAADMIGRDIKPPIKNKTTPGARGAVVTQEPDYEDQGFIEKVAESNRLRMAYVLSNGLIGFEIPGEDLKQKSDALRKLLPARVMNALYSSIIQFTSDPVELASFT